MLLDDDEGRPVGSLGLQGDSGVAGVYSVRHGDPRARPRSRRRAELDGRNAAARRSATTPHKLELEVWPDNGPAISLYTRYGFEVEGLRRSHYRRRDGSLRSSLIMARLLRP